MSKARELANLGNAYSDGALSNRNLIINGAMQVAQRGTSFTADNVYTLDRWKSGDGTGGTPARTLSQETFTLGQTDVPNAHYYLRHDQTGASTNGNASLNQKIEDVTRFDGVAVTLSFYAKANAAMDINVRFIQDFGTGGTPSADVTLSETVSIGTSWQLYTVTKTLGSLSGKTLGTDGVHTSFLSLDIEFQPITTFTFDATLFQLELGDTATPFEHRSYGDQLQACRRYYHSIGTANYGGGYELLAHGFCDTTTRAIHLVHLPVQLRASPTLRTSGDYTKFYWRMPIGSPSTATATGLPTIGQQGLNCVRFDCDASSMTVGYGCFFSQNNDTTAYIAFDAEL